MGLVADDQVGLKISGQILQAFAVQGGYGTDDDVRQSGGSVAGLFDFTILAGVVLQLLF